MSDSDPRIFNLRVPLFFTLASSSPYDQNHNLLDLAFLADEFPVCTIYVFPDFLCCLNISFVLLMHLNSRTPLMESDNKRISEGEIACDFMVGAW